MDCYLAGLVTLAKLACLPHKGVTLLYILHHLFTL
nr:MAG TPA: hypothetical protein [Crassvirales sp.]